MPPHPPALSPSGRPAACLPTQFESKRFDLEREVARAQEREAEQKTDRDRAKEAREAEAAIIEALRAERDQLQQRAADQSIQAAQREAAQQAEAAGLRARVAALEAAATAAPAAAPGPDPAAMARLAELEAAVAEERRLRAELQQSRDSVFAQLQTSQQEAQVLRESLNPVQQMCNFLLVQAGQPPAFPDVMPPADSAPPG
ncbi:hypothetical protein PAPYR_10202 [Paratrimastix pyriformis]|uniref:Uncharacterized protein n=1 Tax=Paratrimastix pyriformis TaxID=342808 RepID=A0ABQ8U890_9EUKA|nr:hypothetical protein PAPYR_10202 [Paratrimastix pyriformis]